CGGMGVWACGSIFSSHTLTPPTSHTVLASCYWASVSSSCNPKRITIPDEAPSPVDSEHAARPVAGMADGAHAVAGDAVPDPLPARPGREGPAAVRHHRVDRLQPGLHGRPGRADVGAAGGADDIR